MHPAKKSAMDWVDANLQRLSDDHLTMPHVSLVGPAEGHAGRPQRGSGRWILAFHRQ